MLPNVIRNEEFINWQKNDQKLNWPTSVKDRNDLQQEKELKDKKFLVMKPPTPNLKIKVKKAKFYNKYHIFVNPNIDSERKDTRSYLSNQNPKTEKKTIQLVKNYGMNSPHK